MASSSVLHALSTMASQGGNYYGRLHQTSLQEGRIKSAQEEAARVRQESREYQEGKTAEAQAHAAGVRKEGWERQDASQQESREYQEGKVSASNSAALAEKGMSREFKTYYDKEGNATTVSFDGHGRPMNMTEDELMGLSSAQPKGGVGGRGGKKTVKQIDMEKRFKDAEGALDIMKGLEADGYDPSATSSRIFDNIASSSGFTNWMASSEGQSYKAAASKVVEAFLRDATGAAAPEPEQARYAYMLTPQAGDSEATVKTKRKLLEQSLTSIGEAAGMDQAALRKRFEAQVDAGAREGGFYKEKERAPLSGGRNGRRAAPETPSAADYASKYL